MTRLSMMMVATLTLPLLVHAHGRTPKSKGRAPTSPPQTASSTDKTAAMQNRLDRYFQQAAIPKVKPCWKDVPGKGEITIKFTYTKAGSSWVSEKQEVKSSTLSKAQEAVALKCLKDSVRATSFPAEESERAANKFVVYWSFPVPTPAEGFRLARPAGQNAGNRHCYNCLDGVCAISYCCWTDCEQGPIGKCEGKGSFFCVSGGYGGAGKLAIQ